jgi:hypothetical protein
MNDNSHDPEHARQHRACVKLTQAYLGHVADLRARTRRRLRELGMVEAIADAIVEDEDCDGLRAIADDVGASL